MRDYPANVDPWTIGWFETLPAQYQVLDEQQRNPILPKWEGAIPEPFLFTPESGWTVLEYEDGYRFYNRTDIFAQPGRKYFLQIWYKKPAIAGENQLGIYLSPRNGGTSPSFIREIDNIVSDGYVEYEFYPPKDGMVQLACISKSLAAQPTTGMLPTPYAISIGPSRYLLEHLPGGGAPRATNYPMLKFMDGVGRIAGEYRQVSDDLWAGKYTNPDTVPDHALRWLGQMTGFNALSLNSDRFTLRTFLKEMLQGKRRALGSRQHLFDMITSLQMPDKRQGRISIQPHPSDPWTIRIYVAKEDFPGQDLAWLGRKLRETRMLPAGHVLEIMDGLPTWDQWEAAVGATWDDLESKATKWSEMDVLGRTFE
ncbi:hypothetical protein [Glutamicibacter sp. TV12E]|uniref:hypothetical protein n=1 Tax=Glutamicibacter sp. TV12E TaxID=3446362 RepID=UPI00403397A4